MRILPKWIDKWPVLLAMILTSVLMMAGCGGTASTSNNVTATPTFSPGGGTYNTSQSVTISDATSGAVLYCTTDGTTPTSSSPQCAQPTTVYKTEFLQAIAVAPGKTASAVASAGYTIDFNAAATPSFSPAGGTYTSSQTVKITDTISGANIYYTTDGSTPTASSTLYTGPITVSSSETLSAIATASGYNNSGVASAAYTINLTPAPTPVISPNGGAVASGQQVTITDHDSAATIYYTTDGTTPSATHGTQYAAPITVTSPETIEAVAVEAGYPNSTVASAAFTLLPQAATPSFQPAAGAVPSGQQVTLASSSGTTIYYAFGTTPTTSSLLYTGPIAVTSAETINAIAVGSAYSPSNIGSAAYTILPAPVVTGISPATGTTAGGTSVILSGTGFTGATAVQFGSAPATSFTVNSATSITAVSPAASAGAVDIEVVAPGGTSAASAADRFTYAVPTPTVTGISPVSGPAAGGTSVTITGTNFIGATAVSFGSAAATSFTVNSATSITAVSPAGSGAVDIKVVTSSGTSAAVSADQFTYIPAPVVTGISAVTGATTGGTSVTITGTNFTGATAVNFGSVAATSFTVNSATSITAVAPAESAGTVDIRIVTPGGTSSPSTADQFTYAVPIPAVSGISPAVGPTAGGTSVTITGANFTGATAVNFGSSAAASFTVNSATKITAVSPAGTAGAVDIRVVTSSGTSAIATADQFTYVSGPAVDTIAPASGPTTGGTSVAITGANFTGTTAVSFGSTAATSFTVNSATSITAVSPAGSGTVDIKVVTPNGGTSAVVSADQFTYAPTPAVTGISLSSGSTAGGASVTITGTGFSGTNFTASAVSFGGTAATSFTVNSATSITAVAPAESAGTVDITVVTPGGTSTANTADRFTYVVPVPTVTGISPASGYTTGGDTVMITGTNFSGATAVNFGSTAANFTYNSATSITAVSPAESAGTVDIRVVTPSGTSVTSSADQFTYTVPPPTVTGISPAFGVTAGGTTVTITGTGFSGATAVNFGNNAVTNITVNTAGTSITAVSPAGSNGTVDITVVTASGTSATVNADQFTYGPVITGRVVSGSTAISGATVQLYAAGTTGYGSTPTTADLDIKGNLTTDANGNFAMVYTCPAAPGDLLYLVASGGNAGNGTNSNISLMTALGSCNSSSFPSTATVNEVTTIASAYALSAFTKVPTSGSGIDIGAPATLNASVTVTPTGGGTPITSIATKCDEADNWQSTGPETCNYNGFVSAFKAVKNLVNVTAATDAYGVAAGAARSITPAYANGNTPKFGTDGTLCAGSTSTTNGCNISGSPANYAAAPYLNSSTVPTLRINALADMLATCVESDGSGCASGLFAGATTGAITTTSTLSVPNVTPIDTLQAALNIAQNPGNNVSTLLGLVSSMASQPYNTGSLLTQTTKPVDLALALTFTGAGLGINPNTISGVAGTLTTTINSTAYTHIMPSNNTALTVDASGNVWVAADVYSKTSAFVSKTVSPFLAVFDNLGTPLTTPTTVSGTVASFGGFSPDPGFSSVLNPITFDQAGNLWAAETGSASVLDEITGFPSSLTSTTVIPTVAGMNSPGSMAVDGNIASGQTVGNVWLSNSSSLWEVSPEGTYQRYMDVAGIKGAPSFSYMVFDSYEDIWATTSYWPSTLKTEANDFVEVASAPSSPSSPYSFGTSPVLDGYSSGESSKNTAPPIADGSGHVYLCADSSGIVVDTFIPGNGKIGSGFTPASGRGCGQQMVLDGQGHLFTVMNNTSYTYLSTAKGSYLDEFTTTGAQILPLVDAYPGSSSVEPPTLAFPISTTGISAMDASGNLWVLNGSTNASEYISGVKTAMPANALVEFVGIGAPVVTPASTALSSGTLGARP